MSLDMDVINEFIGKFAGDLGATVSAGGVVTGHRLGLFKALAEGPATPDELAARTGTDPQYAPVMRGARDLNEAREFVHQLEHPEPAHIEDRETLQRFKELIDLPPRELLRELKAAGGDLKALRLALTGRATGPELAAIVAALPRDEALRRVDAAAGSG